MFVPFNTLPDHARIWIYLADRTIEQNERSIIERELWDFTTSWTAHGQPLEASFLILENRFVVLGINEQLNDASGCSIDKSTTILKAIGQSIGLDFFKRTFVLSEMDGDLKEFGLKDLKQKFRDGAWNEHSMTFNTLAVTAGALREKWRVQASESWIKRYIEPRTFDSVNG